MFDPAGVEGSGQRFPWVSPTATDVRPLRGRGAQAGRFLGMSALLSADSEGRDSEGRIHHDIRRRDVCATRECFQ